jgi:hypothetical protein
MMKEDAGPDSVSEPAFGLVQVTLTDARGVPVIRQFDSLELRENGVLLGTRGGVGHDLAALDFEEGRWTSPLLPGFVSVRVEAAPDSGIRGGLTREELLRATRLVETASRGIGGPAVLGHLAALVKIAEAMTSPGDDEIGGCPLDTYMRGVAYLASRVRAPSGPATHKES